MRRTQVRTHPDGIWSQGEEMGRRWTGDRVSKSTRYTSTIKIDVGVVWKGSIDSGMWCFYD